VSLAGPVLALTSGGTASVPAPKVPTPPCTVLLQNVSPYALQAQIQGGTVWIPPYTQQSVPWSNSVGVTVSAEPVITSPSGAPASLLVTFYNQGEVVPPNGPITGYTSITGAVVNATISGPVTISGTVAISSGTVDVGTVAGAISIAANQVVQVENVPAGTVVVGGTVAISSGTINVGTISGSISIAAGQVVQVENVPAGTVVVGGTVAISSGTVNIGTISGSVTIASGSVDIGSGNITIVGGQGGATNVGTYLPPVQVGQITPLSVGSNAVNCVLPPGTQAVKITFWGGYGSGRVISGLYVLGITTGLEYLNNVAPQQDVIVLPIDQVTEPGVVQVAFTSRLAGGGVTVVAVLGNATVDVGDSPQQPVFTQPVVAQPVGLLMQSANLTHTVTANTVFNPVPAIATEVITVWSVDLTLGAASNNAGYYLAALRSSATSVLVAAVQLYLASLIAGSSTVPITKSFPLGLALPAGEGLDIELDTSAGGPPTWFTCGSVQYTQA
jgi:hypothetical protein